jgi:LacI family transcriptional regulator
VSGRANIRDVATRAGVSVKTVSRVLNDHRYVGEATRQKVEAAMSHLDFRPSVAARILAGTKSGQIALIYDNHSPYYMNRIQLGCWQRCQAEGLRLLAQPVDVSDPNIGSAVRDLVRETHVDGVILSSPVTDCPAVLEALESMDVPFVRISPGCNHALTSSVFMDDAQAADDITTHLANLGHRQIGFIKGHSNHAASQDRLLGYRRGLGRAGIVFRDEYVRAGAFDFDSGVEAAIAMLDLPSPPTAIFASNDDMAAGVLSVAHDRGMDVPRTLSVAGFDDTTLARMVWPTLTTIHQPMSELAEAATGLLLESGPAQHVRLPHRLIIRGSTSRPPPIKDLA